MTQSRELPDLVRARNNLVAAIALGEKSRAAAIAEGRPHRKGERVLDECRDKLKEADRLIRALGGE